MAFALTGLVIEVNYVQMDIGTSLHEQQKRDAVGPATHGDSPSTGGNCIQHCLVHAGIMAYTGCSMNNRPWAYLACLAFAALTFGLTTPPSTDPSMDSILGLSQHPAASQPQPTTQTTPLKSPGEDDQTRPGELTLSNGTKVKGKITTTVEKPLRIWVEKEKNYEDVPLDQIESAVATVVWERDEKEWNFKETGSDIKVYSGKTYPARQTQYKFTLTDGTIIQGDVVAPLYTTTEDGKTSTYVLYKRDKGKVGQKLVDLIYVKSVEFK